MVKGALYAEFEDQAMNMRLNIILAALTFGRPGGSSGV